MRNFPIIAAALALGIPVAAHAAADCCKDMTCCREGAACCKDPAKDGDHPDHAKHGDRSAPAPAKAGK